MCIDIRIPMERAKLASCNCIEVESELSDTKNSSYLRGNYKCLNLTLLHKSECALEDERLFDSSRPD